MKYSQTIFYSDLLDKYIQIILDCHFEWYKKSNIGYNFRCNICGDSKKDKNKARGWILKNKEPWVYYCFNCGRSITVITWMKSHFYSTYMDYINESFRINETSNVEKLNTENPNVTKITDDKPQYDEYQDVKWFKKINSSDDGIFKIAKQFCIKRMIPQSIWNKWFVACGGKFVNRLIIPYYDNKGMIYCYQGRSLLGNHPKYLSRLINSSCQLYNIYNIDKDKPVICLEGLIDSHFVENSIAMAGVKVNSLTDIKKKYFLLDNDKRGKQESLSLLKLGEFVFLWDKFLHFCGIHPDKCEKDDINDIIIKLNRKKPFTFDELNMFFTNLRTDIIHFM